MFTGIIENIGLVTKVVENNDLNKIFIDSSFDIENIKIGDSVSVNGVCLTVSDIIDNLFVFDAVKETLKITNLKFLEKNSQVNLERALMLSDRIDGHIVQGHIESMGEVIDILTDKDQMELFIKIQESQCRYCIKKGSIAINGISLTISDINKNILKFCIIPHTLKNTTLSTINKGDYVNIETDMLSKYVERIIEYNNV